MAAVHESRPDQVQVLLLGERESGKSSAGNSILGRRAFSRKTTHSSKETAAIFEQQVTVVDTPGWSSQSPAPVGLSQELRRGLALCHPEPDVILLVLPISSPFGQQAWGAMEAQLRRLQVPIWQRAMVLFTHGDELGGVSFQDHLRRQGPTLHWLLERCGNRFQVLSNRSEDSEVQVGDLLEKVQKMMEVNRRPREVQSRMYIQLRQEVSMKERRRREEREIMEMGDVHDGGPRLRQQISARWHRVSRGLPAVLKPPLGLILLGRRRSGKSSAGNLILGREEFQTDVKTTRSSAGRGEVSGWAVTVVDTPGWSLFGLADADRVRMEISQSRSLCPGGGRVGFLLAVPVDSFKEKDRRAVETFLGVLGSSVWTNTVVLFTFGGQLRGRTLEDHVDRNGTPLQWVLDRCGHRHHVCHTGNQTEVTRLLEMVERLP